MKRERWMIFAAILVAAAALDASIPPGGPAVPPVPYETQRVRVTEVRPGEAFPGDFATLYGFNLDADRVKEVWLVEGKATFRVEILEQSAHSILFRLPAWIPAGRWQIAVVTEKEMLIEQGVYFRVRPVHGLPTG